MKQESLLDFDWFSFRFADQQWLWLLLIVPFIFYFQFIQINSNKSQFRFSDISLFNPNSFLNFIPVFLISCTSIALVFLILALARPQLMDEGVLKQKEVEGIDIVIALDVSESMLAEDFRPNRLEVAKEVAMKFIKDRPQDRIGLVVYEGQSFTQCPLTYDHKALLEKFKEVHTGYIEPGTAIGMGLATSVNRLRDSKAKSKVIILLTDGVNNQGSIDPLTAAELAREFGIRVYCIGVGQDGNALFPARDAFGGVFKTMLPVEIDEVTLKKIAETTDGKYFRAKNKKGLEKIYKEIDKMEKTKVKINEFKLDPPEKFHSFLFMALLLWGIPLLLKKTILRSVNE